MLDKLLLKQIMLVKSTHSKSIETQDSTWLNPMVRSSEYLKSLSTISMIVTCRYNKLGWFIILFFLAGQVRASRFSKGAALLSPPPLRSPGVVEFAWTRKPHRQRLMLARLCQNTCEIECQKNCQIECRRIDAGENARWNVGKNVRITSQGGDHSK